jgi:hypothetical protein
VWFTSANAGNILVADIDDLEISDCFVSGSGGCRPIQNDGQGATKIIGTNIAQEIGHEAAFTSTGSPPENFLTAVTPPSYGGYGTVGGRYYGVLGSVREFSPTAVVSANLATQVPSSWSDVFGTCTIGTNCTVTTAIAAPDGTTGAGQFSTTLGGGANLFFYDATPSVSVGDFFIVGGWVKSQTANGISNSVALGFQLTGGGAICTGHSIGGTSTTGNFTGIPQVSTVGWQWYAGACQVTNAGSSPSVYMRVYADSTHTVQVYAPILLHIASGAITANDAWELAYNLQSYSASCAVGTICGLPGQKLVYPQYGTETNCAVNSVSPAACGSAAAGAVVIPTTTTTYTINTSAVTAHSRIQLTWMSFAGDLPGSPTCVAPVATTEPTVSAISAGVSFTIALGSTTGQTCPMYSIMD